MRNIIEWLKNHSPLDYLLVGLLILLVSLVFKLPSVISTNSTNQAQLTAVLSEAKENLISEIESKRTKAKTGELQGQLNRMFYPVGSNAFNTDYAN